MERRNFIKYTAAALGLGAWKSAQAQDVYGLSGLGTSQEKPQQAVETSAYYTTFTCSILDKAAKEIETAGKGTLVAARFPYITDLRVANALGQASRNGANISVILSKNPCSSPGVPVKNYSGNVYLAKNKINVFEETLPKDVFPTESYIILSQSSTVIILSIPPDPIKERKSIASVCILRNNVAARNTLIKSFSMRLEDHANVSSFTIEPSKTQLTDDK